MIKFVPESAELSNPIWGPYLRMLATELTRERMRAALIARLVGISPREASAMYRAVHDSSPPSGLIPQATASFYTTGRDSRDASAPQRNLHSTLFLVVWRRLRLAVGEPRPHRGWLLLQAYRAYTVHADHYLDRDAALDGDRGYCQRGDELWRISTRVRGSGSTSLADGGRRCRSPGRLRRA